MIPPGFYALRFCDIHGRNFAPLCPKCDALVMRLEGVENLKALGQQVGGDHYKKLKIQPLTYIHANGIPFAEGSVIKYVTRWRDKGGIDDLRKAKHFLEMLIELESAK